MTWIRTNRGYKTDLLNPQPDQCDIEDITDGLSRHAPGLWRVVSRRLSNRQTHFFVTREEAEMHTRQVLKAGDRLIAFNQTEFKEWS